MDEPVAEEQALARGRLAILRAPWSNIALFCLTVVSTFYVGAELIGDGGSPLRGWVFAVPLLAILVTHEFGHWIQAKRHKVDASLPFFIPLPIGLGTMGAVIAMRGRIKTRDALFDIGASGPIAGLLVAVPVLVVGLKLSTVGPVPPHGLDEGQSLLYLALKRIVLGPIPEGHDVLLHPVAFAGWAGLFMTMLNLVPVGQLDGGHVAYALFGPAQDRYARVVHRAVLAVGIVVGLYFAAAAVRAHAPVREAAEALFTGYNWLVWYGLLWLLTRRGNHPPTEPGALSPVRKVVAWATLATFVLLFMPVPFRVH